MLIENIQIAVGLSTGIPWWVIRNEPMGLLDRRTLPPVALRLYSANANLRTREHSNQSGTLLANAQRSDRLCRTVAAYGLSGL